MARKPKKNQELIKEYENADQNNEKIDKSDEKPTWENLWTAKLSWKKIV